MRLYLLYVSASTHHFYTDYLFIDTKSRRETSGSKDQNVRVYEFQKDDHSKTFLR